MRIQVVILLSLSTLCVTSANNLFQTWPWMTQYRVPMVNVHHSADGEGGYVYQYTLPHHNKQEQRTQDGTVTGSYSYLSPDGNVVRVTYTADDNGYRPVITTTPVRRVQDEPTLDVPQVPFLVPDDPVVPQFPFEVPDEPVVPEEPFVVADEDEPVVDRHQLQQQIFQELFGSDDDLVIEMNDEDEQEVVDSTDSLRTFSTISNYMNEYSCSSGAYKRSGILKLKGRRRQARTLSCCFECVSRNTYDYRKKRTLSYFLQAMSEDGATCDPGLRCRLDVERLMDRVEDGGDSILDDLDIDV